MLCYAMLCYAMLRYAMLCYAMLCYAMLCYAMLCYAMLCYASYAMPCYGMLCCVVLCYAMLCYAMLCYVLPIHHVFGPLVVYVGAQVVERWVDGLVRSPVGAGFLTFFVFVEAVPEWTLKKDRVLMVKPLISRTFGCGKVGPKYYIFVVAYHVVDGRLLSTATCYDQIGRGTIVFVVRVESKSRRSGGAPIHSEGQRHTYCRYTVDRSECCVRAYDSLHADSPTNCLSNAVQEGVYNNCDL